MARGGVRQGAGRKPGATTRFNEEARTQAAAGGLMPLDYLLAILRDQKQNQDVRTDAAKAAAPYLHAKLANIEANHTGKIDSETTFKVDWMTEAEAKKRGWV